MSLFTCNQDRQSLTLILRIGNGWQQFQGYLCRRNIAGETLQAKYSSLSGAILWIGQSTSNNFFLISDSQIQV
jgi:hypothetical protein